MIATDYNMLARLFGFYSAFNKKERLVFWLIMLSCVFDGMTQGVLLLQETIAKKAMAASDFQISVIGLLANATMLLSLVVSFFFSNRSKKWILIPGMILGRLIFILAFLLEGANLFLLLLFFYYSLYAVQGPIINSFYQKHIAQKKGQVFGLTRMVLMVFSMATSLIVGRLLDLSPQLYKPILMSIAVTGGITYLLFIVIDSHIAYRPESKYRMRRTARDLKVMFKRTDFLMFELAFMTYGLAFMVMVPAVPLFMLNQLKFSYSQMAQAKGVFAQIFMLALMPLAGMIFDRINLWKIAAISYAIMVGYPLLMLLSSLYQSRILAYASLCFFSLGLTGVVMLWNLGSLHFAGNRDSLVYQGLHVTLTGVRGFLGPLLGYYLLSRVSYQADFILAMILFAGASGMSLYFKRKYSQVFAKI